jgi:hypothetical protein
MFDLNTLVKTMVTKFSKKNNEKHVKTKTRNLICLQMYLYARKIDPWNYFTTEERRISSHRIIIFTRVHQSDSWISSDPTGNRSDPIVESDN